MYNLLLPSAVVGCSRYPVARCLAEDRSDAKDALSLRAKFILLFCTGFLTLSIAFRTSKIEYD